MKHKKLFLMIAFIFINLSLSVSSSSISMEEDPLYLQFLTELNNFSKKHSIDNEKLNTLLGRVVLNEEKLAKGGIGIIREGLFIKLNGAKNSIILNGESWEGKASKQNEIVIVNGNTIINPVGNHNISLDKLVIIIFSRDEVRYVDLTKMSGGKYIRY